MRKLLYITIGLALAVLTAVVSAYLSYNLIVARVTVEVPDLTGMDVAEAGALLSGKNLRLLAGAEEYDLIIPKGSIISQDVPAGSHLTGASEIEVSVSRGPAVRFIPLVTGMALGEARKMFSKDGLDFSLIRVHSKSIEEDIVIAQRPKPEEWAGQGITVVASAGTHDVTYYCPDFVGYTMAEAASIAEELGLELEFLNHESSAYYVDSQDPPPGASIKAGGTVQLKLRGEF